MVTTGYVVPMVAVVSTVCVVLMVPFGVCGVYGVCDDLVSVVTMMSVVPKYLWWSRVCVVHMVSKVSAVSVVPTLSMVPMVWLCEKHFLTKLKKMGELFKIFKACFQ